MAVAADDPRDGHGDWRPVPDPTTLTTEQLRRELSALREILTARLDGMDAATRLLDETVNRTPTIIQTEIKHLRELQEEKFSSVTLQFAERDIRTQQAATASSQALAAALQAAKEAVFEQAQAAAKAAEKAELSTIKQIDQIGLRIDTVAKGYDDRITELKQRLDRGEGTTTGTAAATADNRSADSVAQTERIAQAMQARATISIFVASIAGLIALLAMLAFVFKK